MFEGFETRRIDTGDVTLNVRTGGDGPPLLLLHGYPQTGAMWAPIAESLARRYSVVVPDLRGYGRSDKPQTDARHAPYSKRAMAGDMVALMDALGHDGAFRAAGHDRGARVLHRLALDHPDRVACAAVLDIVPTHRIFATVGQALATAYYHWFFLIQPTPFPETLIGHDPDYFLDAKLAAWSAPGMVFPPEARAEYAACFAEPQAIHASCEDYRAAATIDLEHDESDFAAGHRVACPLLALWGAKGAMARLYDVPAEWRAYADDVRGHAIESGHFLVEEAPVETLAALEDFFRDAV